MTPARDAALAGPFTHKGYTGSAKFEDGVYFGEVDGLRDVVTFESETAEDVAAAFRESVDDYLAMTRGRICSRCKRTPRYGEPLLYVYKREGGDATQCREAELICLDCRGLRAALAAPQSDLTARDETLARQAQELAEGEVVSTAPRVEVPEGGIVVGTYTIDFARKTVSYKPADHLASTADADELARLREDKARLDWLEVMANEPDGILLHDGSDWPGRTGLGLRPGTLVRTLRAAIDAARAAEGATDER